MIEQEAAEQLAALGHPARLAVLRTLMAAGTHGARAGELAAAAHLAANATTFHLNRLRLAGLAQRQRVGREVRYTADFAAVKSLLDFLGETCCTDAEASGHCGPICGVGLTASTDTSTEDSR
ncbi:MAG: helix-turn-helix transcriptional regulator [Halofilum sp. (in: g-proteobacteria)]